MWPRLVPPSQVDAAYALDSTCQELVWIGGPLLLALLLAGGSRSTEAFAWTFAVITVTMAAGSAFGGVIIQGAGKETAFLSAGDLAWLAQPSARSASPLTVPIKQRSGHHAAPGTRPLRRSDSSRIDAVSPRIRHQRPVLYEQSRTSQRTPQPLTAFERPISKLGVYRCRRQIITVGRLCHLRGTLQRRAWGIIGSGTVPRRRFAASDRGRARPDRA